MKTTFQPELLDAECFIAENATLRGEVFVGKQACVLFGAVIRGDIAPVQIGAQSNIQDLCCLHGDPGFPCSIGDRVTVGHGAIVHGATVENECLIGIRAVILNGAVIGAGSIVAAGALVPEGKVIPPNSLVMGVPAKIVRQTTDADFAMIQRGWQHYVEMSKCYSRTERIDGAAWKLTKSWSGSTATGTDVAS
jgi:carbonic anhydrase/acetyltransferase-like protein (isoleucine patch superfamily)